MQILKRANLSSRDIADLKVAYEQEQRREQINDTAASLQELADKIRDFWEAETVELTPAGNIYINGQLSRSRWRQGMQGIQGMQGMQGMQGGQYIWYNLPELQQAGKATSKIIKGPWM